MTEIEIIVFFVPKNNHLEVIQVNQHRLLVDKLREGCDDRIGYHLLLSYYAINNYWLKIHYQQTIVAIIQDLKRNFYSEFERRSLLFDFVDWILDLSFVSLRNRAHVLARTRARCLIDILSIEH